MKRDDLSGLGAGGNKVRKLQYTCAQALAAGATTVMLLAQLSGLDHVIVAFGSGATMAGLVAGPAPRASSSTPPIRHVLWPA